MKIDETLSAASAVNALNRSQASTETANAARIESGSKTDVGASDSATLSAGATLASQMANASDVRMDKVTNVQQALAAGTYKVDAGQVADKIIASMLENH